MSTTTSLLAEHRLATDDIMLIFLQRFKNCTDATDKFLTQLIEEFREKIIEAGANLLHRSVSEDIEGATEETEYELVLGIKKINTEISQKLMAALTAIVKYRPFL